MKPELTLVIVVYNGGEFIQEALSSLEKQTVSPDEIIVYNDASTDGTVDCLKRSPLPIRVIHGKKRRGTSFARRMAVNAAVGDYVLFLDADDRMMPDSVEKFLEAVVEHPEVDGVFGMVRHFFSETLSDLERKNIHSREGWNPGHLTGTLCVRKLSWLKAADPLKMRKIIQGEFQEWYQVALDQGQRFMDIPVRISERRIHQTNNRRTPGSQSITLQILKKRMDQHRQRKRDQGVQE